MKLKTLLISKLMIESYLKDLPDVESNYELINDYKECIEDIENQLNKIYD